MFNVRSVRVDHSKGVSVARTASSVSGPSQRHAETEGNIWRSNNYRTEDPGEHSTPQQVVAGYRPSLPPRVKLSASGYRSSNNSHVAGHKSNGGLPRPSSAKAPQVTRVSIPAALAHYTATAEVSPRQHHNTSGPAGRPQSAGFVGRVKRDVSRAAGSSQSQDAQSACPASRPGSAISRSSASTVGSSSTCSTTLSVPLVPKLPITPLTKVAEDPTTPRGDSSVQQDPSSSTTRDVTCQSVELRNFVTLLQKDFDQFRFSIVLENRRRGVVQQENVNGRDWGGMATHPSIRLLTARSLLALQRFQEARLEYDALITTNITQEHDHLIQQRAEAERRGVSVAEHYANRMKVGDVIGAVKAAQNLVELFPLVSVATSRSGGGSNTPRSARGTPGGAAAWQHLEASALPLAVTWRALLSVSQLKIGETSAAIASLQSVFPAALDVATTPVSIILASPSSARQSVDVVMGVAQLRLYAFNDFSQAQECTAHCLEKLCPSSRLGTATEAQIGGRSRHHSEQRWSVEQVVENTSPHPPEEGGDQPRWTRAQIRSVQERCKALNARLLEINQLFSGILRARAARAEARTGSSISQSAAREIQKLIDSLQGQKSLLGGAHELPKLRAVLSLLSAECAFGCDRSELSLQEAVVALDRCIAVALPQSDFSSVTTAALLLRGRVKAALQNPLGAEADALKVLEAAPPQHRSQGTSDLVGSLTEMLVGHDDPALMAKSLLSEIATQRREKPSVRKPATQEESESSMGSHDLNFSTKTKAELQEEEEAKQEAALNAMNHYELLGLHVRCTQVEVKRAYRAKALLWHPDKWAATRQHQNVATLQLAERRFKKSVEAFNVLYDTKKRMQYDCHLLVQKPSR